MAGAKERAAEDGEAGWEKEEAAKLETEQRWVEGKKKRNAKHGKHGKHGKTERERERERERNARVRLSIRTCLRVFLFWWLRDG